MDLSKAKLTTSSVSTMLDVTDRTVNYWCKNNKVRSEQKEQNGNYLIYADSLVKFLYHNPKYTNPYLEQKTAGIAYLMQEAIRKELAKYPKSYSIRQIAKKYHVTENAIRHWVRVGFLHNHAREEGVNGIFEKDLEEFFEENPGIARQYVSRKEKYNEEDKSIIAI